MTPALLYVDPNSAAARAAASATGEDKRLLTALAAYPTAKWLGEWTVDPETAVSNMLAVAGVRVFVIYAIPHRDGEAYSKGGEKNAGAYRRLIAAIAKAIKARKATVPKPIVIMEPDGLALTDFLAPAELRERELLIAEATQVLTAAGARVYIDAGNSNWIPTVEMAKRLNRAGVWLGAGIALNVAHTEWLANEYFYFGEIGATLGSSIHAVIDTSRAGLGPDGDVWCNPRGRGIGRRPTLQTGVAGLDAILFVKPPGDSDGPCFGGPAAGKFWPEYALQLARNAQPAL